MATYALIAGAWHGSWCWSEVVPLLEAAGHRVLTPDLLGMRAGQSAIIEEPLTVWADQIAALLRRESHPIILVGHSRAGLVISEVAERIPEKIDLLVYLAAFLLQSGQTLNDVAQHASNAEAIGEAVLYHDNATVALTNEGVERWFYNMTTEPFLQLVRARIVVEPVASFVTPIHVTKQRFGAVRRAYIECRHDRAIPLDAQRAMQDAMPVSITDRLDSDHSPFYSMPAALVMALERVRQGTHAQIGRLAAPGTP
jgi:pimeloyl-ACP methyl ester carboxylesterase